MTTNRFTFFIPVLCFLLLGGLLWRGLYLDSRTLPSMLIDKAMPEFSLRTVRGEPVTNGDLPNEIFLLNVWGSYCLPCLVEHPTFMRLTEEDQIKVVGINYKDRNELATSWLETNGNPFAYSIEDENGRFGIDLGVYGAPETYLVDSEGVIRFRHVSVLDETVWAEKFVPAIEELRAESSEDKL